MASSCLAQIREEAGLPILHSFFVGSKSILGYGKLHVLLDSPVLPEYRVYTADLTSGYVNDNYTSPSVYDYPAFDKAPQTPSVTKAREKETYSW
jgi:hypothetical protein